jgi:hypothetical protein
MAGNVGSMGEMRIAYRILVGITLTLEIIWWTHLWEDNISMNLKE